MMTLTTYIFIREDGKCCHVNGGYGLIGREYEHDDPNWLPPEDWPYDIIDNRED